MHDMTAKGAAIPAYTKCDTFLKHQRHFPTIYHLRKGAKRRLYITGTGKVMHRKGQISHLRKRKSKRALAKISDKLMASKPMQKIGHQLLPYA